MRFDFDSFQITAPDDWEDLTSYDKPGRPWTLAHPDGVGALQFSIAHYRLGPKPKSGKEDLLEMLKEFGTDRRLGAPRAVVLEDGPPLLAAGEFAWDDDFIRVWEISDGRHFAFVTYVCAAENLGPELAICEAIVRSLSFATKVVS